MEFSKCANCDSDLINIYSVKVKNSTKDFRTKNHRDKYLICDDAVGVEIKYACFFCKSKCRLVLHNVNGCIHTYNHIYGDDDKLILNNNFIDI